MHPAKLERHPSISWGNHWLEIRKDCIFIYSLKNCNSRFVKCKHNLNLRPQELYLSGRTVPNDLNLHLKMLWALRSKEQIKDDNYNTLGIYLVFKTHTFLLHGRLWNGIKMERHGKELCMRLALTFPRCPLGGWLGSLSSPFPDNPQRCCCRCRQRGKRWNWRCMTGAPTGNLRHKENITRL